MKKYILVIILFFIFAFNIKAECNDKELLTYAKNVEIKYKEITDSSIDESYYLYLNPQRDDIAFSATNSLFNGISNSSEMYDGVIGIASRLHFEEKTYTIDIYVKKTASVCAGEHLITLNYSVPMYNKYKKTQFCVENPEAEICSLMSETGSLSNEEFALKAQEYGENNNKDEKKLLYIIFFDYLIWILVPAIIFGIVYYRRIKQVKKVKENE